MFEKIRSSLSGSSESEVSTSDKAKAVLKGKRIFDEDELEKHLEDLRLKLLQNNVSVEVADEITESVTEDLLGDTEWLGKKGSSKVSEALQSAILEAVSYGQDETFIDAVEESEKPFVVIFTGVNGVGKTTSIAKISKQLEEAGFSSVMANGDTYRAGATEQIQEHADAIGTELIAHQDGGDPAAVIYDAVEYAEAHDIDVVLGDTAGRLHTDEGLMGQLEKIDRVVDPDRVVFVDEAVAGQDALRRAEQFDEAASIDAVILTKADSDEGGGTILSLPHTLKKPIYYLGTGQSYSDLQQFDPEQISESVLSE